MEKNANYFVVGLTTTLLVLGMIVFGIWLARFAFTRDYDEYDIVFQGPVRGISQGGEVHFNGIKVGEVTSIDLDRRNPSQVIARARVTSNVPIRVDSYATLEPQGITGVNYVQITAGTTSKPLLKDVTPRDRVPVLQSRRSAISDLLEGGGTVLTRTVEALDRVNRVLSDQNIRGLTAMVSDTQAFTAELRERKQIIADAQKALQDIDVATQNFNRVAVTGNEILSTDGRRAVRELADAATEAKTAARSARQMVDKLEGPTSDFATNGLPQISSAVIQLQQAAESLQRLVDDVQSSPTGALGKAPAEEMKVKP